MLLYDAHDLKGINLFAYTHIAQLTGYFAAYNTAQHNANQRRGELQDNSIPYNLCNACFWNDGTNQLVSVCTADTAPIKKEMITTMPREPMPISEHWCINSFQYTFMFSGLENMPFSIKR